MYWAASPNRSGLFWFETEQEQQEWINRNNGFAVAEGQIDPDVLKESKQLVQELRSNA